MLNLHIISIHSHWIQKPGSNNKKTKTTSDLLWPFDSQTACSVILSLITSSHSHLHKKRVQRKQIAVEIGHADRGAITSAELLMKSNRSSIQACRPQWKQSHYIEKLVFWWGYFFLCIFSHLYHNCLYVGSWLVPLRINQGSFQKQL